ncbi:hypothetical protein PSH76_29180 [Pseudomonas sp. FP215]|nr:hypothetical protein [Pseudomonas sp. FP215]WLH27273.1 hypothetical protein PSH76_29180 [Pseudomonas sp. FP215]
MLLATLDAQAENCRLSLSPPRIDYGAIRRDAVVDNAAVVLATRTFNLTVLCVEPAVMALRFVAAPADGQGFRFGREGRFRLRLKHAQVDGRAVGWVSAQAPDESANGQLLPGQALVARAAGAPVAGRRLTAQVDLDTELPFDALMVRGEARLEGQGSFELISQAVPPSQ